MSKPGSDALQAALATGRATRRYDRAGRVELIGEAARALLRGELPSRESQMFVGGGILAFLESGGDLCRDYWLISAPAGSHHTPSHYWREFLPRDEPATQAEGTATLSPSSPESEQGK